MIPTDYKKAEQVKIIRISLLISLVLFTLVFYIFPRFHRIKLNIRQDIPVKIYVSDIPKTEQKKIGKPLPPRRPALGPVVAVEDAELPEEFNFEEMPGFDINTEGASGIPAEVPARPLLEVYPDVSGEKFKGYISLLLLVNKSGKVEEVEILQNSTGSAKCLNLVINAAKKSQWMPARVGDKPVDSWVEKTYKFNVKT